MFPIDICFQLTYASKTLSHDPAPSKLLAEILDIFVEICTIVPRRGDGG